MDYRRIAKQAGFLKRSRKIDPGQFLRALVLASFQAASSFRLIAMLLGCLSAHSITRQAIAKRMTTQCIAFVKGALLALIAKLSTFDKLDQAQVFASFGRVLIQDSTVISLPANLACDFPGPANQARKKSAALKIQAAYDLLGYDFAYFAISGFRRTDQAASSDILDIAKAQDLIIRDLGYFSCKVFKKLLDRGVHFLSRLRHNVSVFDPQTLKPIEILKILRIHGRLDRDVLLGVEHRVPVRLVALPVPEQIANERRRKAKINRDKRCNPSKDHLDLLGWNIFVTSVDSSTWSTETVQQVYGIRWRIEIIFKSWKSHFRLTQTPKGSANQLEVLIWAKLFAICLFQKLLGYLELRSPKPISLLKAAQIFPLLLVSSINLNAAELSLEAINKHLHLETRKQYNDGPVHLLS